MAGGVLKERRPGAHRAGSQLLRPGRPRAGTLCTRLGAGRFWMGTCLQLLKLSPLLHQLPLLFLKLLTLLS